MVKVVVDSSSKRVVTPRTGVVVGSVWESRMKVDEVKGGIKVDDSPEENGDNIKNNDNGLQVYRRMRPKQGPAGISGKRSIWKSESSEGSERNPVQNARQKSELSKNLDGQCKAPSVSVDGIKKTPVRIARQRSELSKNVDEMGKELSAFADGIKKSPIQSMRTRSMSLKGSSVLSGGVEGNPVLLRKVKSELNKVSNEPSDGNGVNIADQRKGKSEATKALDESFCGNERDPSQLVKAESVSNKVLDKSNDLSLADATGRKSIELSKAKIESNEIVDESSDGSAGEMKTSPITIKKTGADEKCKEFGMCEEKIIASNQIDVSEVKSPLMLKMTNDDGDKDDWDEELEEEIDEEIEMESENRSFDIKEIRIPEQKPKEIVVEEKKNQKCIAKPVLISQIVIKQPPPVVNHPRITSKATKTKPNEFQKAPKVHSKLQSLADLVMWRDVTRSTFVFGIGTFIITSSSYTKDLNISLISVVSYVGLVYLAAIFLFRSIIRRGAIDDVHDASQEYVVGEEEAVWLINLILPYINELLLKLRALFSGDPATTMKLAALLFVLAQCGSSITIWKMLKLGFFGVFIVPKACSSYSIQITAYGTFWIRRFRDAWDSCSHKKAVAFFIFTMLWNLSSIVARFWAVFMLLVAFRYYQHSMMKEEEEAIGGIEENSLQGKNGGYRTEDHCPTSLEVKKQKKGLKNNKSTTLISRRLSRD